MRVQHTPEVWAECKRVCGNCPIETGDTSGKCEHLWRHLLRLSAKEGVISTDVVARAVGHGASVSFMEDGMPDGIKVRLYVEEPEQKEKWQLFIVEGEEEDPGEIDLGTLMGLYDLAHVDPSQLDASSEAVIRKRLLKLGIHHKEQEVIDTATSGSTEELIELFGLFVTDYGDNEFEPDN